MEHEMRKYIDTFKQKLTESENLNISDVSDSNYTHVAIPLQDLNDRINSIKKQMEILKDNKMYEYALSKMYSLLIELRDTYDKISV
jgi:hypothetical protein